MVFASSLMMGALRDKNSLPVDLPNTQINSHQGTNSAGAAQDEEDDSSQAGIEDSNEGEGGVYRWSDPCVTLPLATYQSYQEKLTDGKQSQKTIWELIAAEMNKKGYNLTGPQCAAKMRSLKKTYKSVNDHNGKSGNDRTWKFCQAVDDIFSHSAWSEPVSVASSSGLHGVKNGPSASSDSGCEGGTLKRKMSPAAALFAKRLKQKAESEQQKEKRHREKMATEEKKLEMDARLLATLEDLLKKWT